MCIYYYKSAYTLKIFPSGAKLDRASSGAYTAISSAENVQHELFALHSASFIALGNAQVDLFPSLFCEYVANIIDNFLWKSLYT